MNKRGVLIGAIALITVSIGAGAQNEVLDAAAAAAAAVNSAAEVQKEVVRPSHWSKSLGLALGVTNTQLTNWVAGGYNTITLDTSIDGRADYKHELVSWVNRLQLDYGFLYSEDKKGLIQQNKDRIYLESKFGYKTGDKSHWSYTASVDFRSQFAHGYKYNSPSEGQSWHDAATLKSGTMAPGYLNVALGIDWRPKDWFTVNIAPLTGGATFCTIPSLRKTYGMHLKGEGLDEEVGTNYKSSLLQLGAQLKVDFKLAINNVFKYETQVVLFSDYLHNPLNLRINWDNRITWQIAKYFGIAFNTWLIYDPNVLIVDDKHPDGAPNIQFKEFLTFNLTYTFKSK